MSTRPNHLENHARELLHQPPEWRIHRWQRLPEDAHYGGFTHTAVTGAVCNAVFLRGPRKGPTNWSKRDPDTDRGVIISDVEHNAWLLAWEKQTGKCHECGGTGQEWAGWNHETGDRYRDCRRCKATGKAPADECEQADRVLKGQP